MHTSWDTRQVSKWDLPNTCHFSMPKKHHGFPQHVQKSAENVGWISRKHGMSGMDLGINVTWPPPMGNLIQRIYICNMCIAIYIYISWYPIYIYIYYTYYIYIYYIVIGYVFKSQFSWQNMSNFCMANCATARLPARQGHQAFVAESQLQHQIPCGKNGRDFLGKSINCRFYVDSMLIL